MLRFALLMLVAFLLEPLGCLVPLAHLRVAAAEDADTKMKAGTFEGLKLRGIGPALMAGRIADIAVHPRDQSTWYVAVGSGGVWKTENAGTTWESIFDGQSSYSIGCISLDPNDPATVWVGSGENVGGRHVGYGDGVYRSRDAGKTWEKLGLETSEHIGTVLVDPRDADVIFVAAQGPLWSAGGERGLFKSVDGGVSWEKILGGGPYTGVNEVRMDPRDPDVLYASTHQRFRNVAALINGGPESGIHKSVDGGVTWRELTEGLPEGDKGKIGLAISPQQPDVVYATIELPDRKGGFYRSSNGGASWEKRSDYVSGGTGPHYYQEIFASPHAFDRVYHMDVELHVTQDGGKSFAPVGEKSKHVDNHAMAFDPHDPDYLLVGCDGGLYESWDLGQNWKFLANLPITQFYKVAVDYDEPFYHVMGGTQDNNTQYGPSRTDNLHGIRNSDWGTTLFGDGHQPAIDYSDPEIIYSQWQQGNLTRYDRVTGEIIYIQPQPELDEEWDRYNWDAPILISPHDPRRLYHASQRLWRSEDRGDSWRAISGDLSRGQDRMLLPMMDRVWSVDAVWDLYAMSKFGTITSISESPLVEGLLYVGTDDGLVHVSEDGGESWRRVDRLPGVPEAFYVNDIKADLHDPDTVYLAADLHKYGDFSPYLLRSADRGRSWKSIASDLPERDLVWRLVQDHVKPELLFVGTEFGVYFTIDAGERWIQLTGDAPTIPFRDLVIQTRENDLVGATFGRSFWILDDYTPLRRVDEAMLEEAVVLFPVREADWYLPRRVLGGSPKAAQGEAFFTASNPPFGAVISYYLAESLQTQREVRREREKKIAEEGGDTPYPGWEALHEESLEGDPAILLTIRDADGEVVRRLAGPVEAGFHRVAWDLRYPELAGWTEVELEDWRGEPKGVLAPPGRYTVSLAQQVDGLVTDLGLEESFDVVPLRERHLKGSPPEEMVAFMKDYAETHRRLDGVRLLLDDTDRRMGAIVETIERATVAPGTFEEDIKGLRRRVADLKLRLSGDPKRDQFSEKGPISIRRRLEVVRSGNSTSTYGPTPTHQRSLEIAKMQLAELSQELDAILRSDLPSLEQRLEDAGVPWTPGRGVPAPGRTPVH